MEGSLSELFQLEGGVVLVDLSPSLQEVLEVGKVTDLHKEKIRVASARA